jgi:ATP-binding cassette subfamily C (CFTR/MRP) protein 1
MINYLIAWIMNATLRDNILFGQRFDPEFYEKTIDACALRQDIEMLPGGDMTEIGEKGINLSGGQKARIALARAVYAMADVYLLDDTLSAVDSHVGRHIFEHVIGPNGLLKHRTRIFVTHALQYISFADQVMMMRDGRIVELDTFDALMEKQGETWALFTEFVKAEEQREAEKQLSPQTEYDLEYLLARSLGSADEPPRPTDARPLTSIAKSTPETDYTRRRRQSTDSVGSLEDGDRRPILAAGAQMTIEESAKGRVKRHVYKAYLKACSVRNALLLLFATVMFQAGSISK